MHDSTYEFVEPTEEQLEAIQLLREAAKAYGEVLDNELPEGPDKTATIRQHRTTAMWAIVALTRLPDGTPRE